LLILDGFERLLTAYHQFDPSKMRDHEVESSQRSLIEPFADEVVRSICTAGPSKILISTRLMPEALEGRFGSRLPGVSHLRLPGLTDADTVTLLERLNVHGTSGATAGFFRRLGNHPLMVGIVAGLVRDYRIDPGSFDSWLSDASAGGRLALPDLDLTQRRTHILAAALAGLAPEHRQLLGWISVLAGTVEWDTLEAINPLRALSSDAHYNSAAVPDSGESGTGRARVALDIALKDLEDRGLLWWDRGTNAYDLHPIVRAYTHDQLEDGDRVRANDRVRNHFEALPPEDPKIASSVEDLRQTITVFRALVGAHHNDEAAKLWQRVLHKPLLVRIGAFATVVELLTPLTDFRLEGVRMDLAAALFFQGRYEAAMAQDVGILGAALETKSYSTIARSLLNIAEDFASMGAEIASARCLDLVEKLGKQHGVDSHLALQLGQAAIRNGRIEEGRKLLKNAKKLGAPNHSPWFDGDIWYWRQYAALVTGGRVDAAPPDALGDDWDCRRRATDLRCEKAIRGRRWDDALSAAQEVERLDRDAGRESTLAITAYVLAELGRIDEAHEALDYTLARLGRLHPADRSHYWLARASIIVGRSSEAREHAHLAYRQAWRDGPPHCNYWSLSEAKGLLDEIAEPVPTLQFGHSDAIYVPLEVEVCEFIGSPKPGKR
jgi:tetratricopeptide (TPR) repeat protein